MEKQKECEHKLVRKKTMYEIIWNKEKKEFEYIEAGNYWYCLDCYQVTEVNGKGFEDVI